MSHNTNNIFKSFISSVFTVDTHYLTSFWNIRIKTHVKWWEKIPRNKSTSKCHWDEGVMLSRHFSIKQSEKKCPFAEPEMFHFIWHVSVLTEFHWVQNRVWREFFLPSWCLCSSTWRPWNSLTLIFLSIAQAVKFVIKKSIFLKSCRSQEVSNSPEI